MSSEDPVPALRVPGLEPVPHPECPICMAAARARNRGHQLGSTVTIQGCNTIIQRHPHETEVEA
ncbi:hypothetical protein [Streptomyces sp. x-80]|uniref:hypothetical protein n=1 Tax=Streptomyces sp. x-80 TaxID=2789282 RepID=UPI00397FFFB4